MQEGTSVCVLFCFPIQVQEKRRVWEMQSPEAGLCHELESGQDHKGWLEWPGENLGKESDIILLFRYGGLSSGSPVWKASILLPSYNLSLALTSPCLMTLIPL